MRFDIRTAIPPVTRNLIALNTMILLAEWILPRIGINLVQLLGLHYVGAPDFRIWQPVTYMFLHDQSGIGHLFFNMFALWMFGSVIERTWGEKKYLLYYLVTGIGAGIVQQVVWHMAMTPELMVYSNWLITIGASGAVFGILLAFGMLYPNVPMYIMFVPIPVKAKWVVIGYGVIELFAGIGGWQSGVAHFAHLGGMLFGLLLILLWRRMDKTKHSRQSNEWWSN